MRNLKTTNHSRFPSTNVFNTFSKLGTVMQIEYLKTISTTKTTYISIRGLFKIEYDWSE